MAGLSSPFHSLVDPGCHQFEPPLASKTGSKTSGSEVRSRPWCHPGSLPFFGGVHIESRLKIWRLRPKIKTCSSLQRFIAIYSDISFTCHIQLSQPPTTLHWSQNLTMALPQLSEKLSPEIWASAAESLSQTCEIPKT